MKKLKRCFCDNRKFIFSIIIYLLIAIGIIFLVQFILYPSYLSYASVCHYEDDESFLDDKDFSIVGSTTIDEDGKITVKVFSEELKLNEKETKNIFKHENIHVLQFNRSISYWKSCGSL